MQRLTEEQIFHARNVDLLDYLQANEPGSVRKIGADVHCLVEHDSFKMSNGKWFWHSRGFGGNGALCWLIKVRGLGFVDAVQSLSAGCNHSLSKPPQPRPPPKKPKPPKPFVLPKPNINNDRMFAYLRGRGISKNIINRCIAEGLLYESDKHRCVFVGKDGDVPKFACERGIDDSLKKDIAGSDKQFSFSLPPENACNGNGLAVFESAVDVLAHLSLCEMWHRSVCEAERFNAQQKSVESTVQTAFDGHRLALGGVGSLALNSFLERNPNITNVRLCLDNDTAGREATSRIIRELSSSRRFSHLSVTNAPPPIGKDFGDTAKAVQEQFVMKEHKFSRPFEAVF